MKFKFCPKCGFKINEGYKFCPECGLDLVKEEERIAKELDEKNQNQLKEDRYAEFRKSVLEVAEAFFAMSEDERKAMVEYVQEKCDEAEEEAEALKNKKYRS